MAAVGIAGTLASAIVTQRLAQQTRLKELEHTERLRMSEKEQADRQRTIDQLRACYVRLNANDRNYRDALLAYAHALKTGGSNEAESAEVATARRAQRDARAEAQMIVSEDVLNAEAEVNAQLSVAFRNLKLSWAGKRCEGSGAASGGHHQEIERHNAHALAGPPHHEKGSRGYRQAALLALAPPPTRTSQVTDGDPQTRRCTG